MGDMTLKRCLSKKRQIFTALDYEIRHPKNSENLRTHLVALRKFYDFCTEESVEDIESLELEDIRRFADTLAPGEERNKVPGIVDCCRKALFMESDEIRWGAPVWYMEPVSHSNGTSGSSQSDPAHIFPGGCQQTEPEAPSAVFPIRDRHHQLGAKQPSQRIQLCAEISRGAQSAGRRKCLYADGGADGHLFQATANQESAIRILQ